MARPRRRDLRTLGPEPVTCEGQPPAARGTGGDEDARRNRQALVDYFRLLQEWSLKAQPDRLVGDPRLIPGTAPKVRKGG